MLIGIVFHNVIALTEKAVWPNVIKATTTVTKTQTCSKLVQFESNLYYRLIHLIRAHVQTSHASVLEVFRLSRYIYAENFSE